MRMVKRRPKQIVHSSVHDHKFFRTVRFAIEYARQKHTCFAHNGASRLDHDFKIAAGHLRQQGGDELVNGGRLFAGLIADAETAAEIEGTDGDAARAQPVDQRDHLFESIHHGTGVEQLRADMAAHAVEQRCRRVSLAR